MKKRIFIIVVLSIVLLFNISATSVHATPQTMSDGTTFDPEYYATNNPDVVNIYGNSTEKLYRHYVDFGKSEGRKATADSKTTKDILDELREKYPTGSVWDSNTTYTHSSMGQIGTPYENTETFHTNYGGTAFAYLVGSAVWDNTTLPYNQWITYNNPVRVRNDGAWPGTSDTVVPYMYGNVLIGLNRNGTVIPWDPSNVRTGDLYIWRDIFILSVNYDTGTITVAEGDINGKVRWDTVYPIHTVFHAELTSPLRYE